MLGSEVAGAAAASPEVAGGGNPGTASVLVSSAVVPGCMAVDAEVSPGAAVGAGSVVGTEVADVAAAGSEVEGARVDAGASGAAGDVVVVPGSEVDDAAVGMGGAGAAKLVAVDSVAGGEGALVAPDSAFTGPGG